jgi:3D (Asp-Asp-Asp) domain-containing protein
MNRSCKPISKVPRGFYEAVCVQGSGTLVSGKTVSFAKRDCKCAEVCPRTDQKICFDELDGDKFPWGRGAQGTAITPLRTIAVDIEVIPLGTWVYILEYDGVPRSSGSTARHDGCFVAQDRGMKVVGEHVDIFTGNPRATEHFNALIPSNRGVHVYVGTARCDAVRQ